MSLTNTLIRKPISNTTLRREYVVEFAEIKAGGAFTTVDIVLDRFAPGSIIYSDRIWHEAALVGPSVSAGTARLSLITEATTPVQTQLGAGALNIFLAPGVLDATSSITGVTPVAGDLEAYTKLVMTVTSTGANLSVVTAGEVHAVVDYAVVA